MLGAEPVSINPGTGSRGWLVGWFSAGLSVLKCSLCTDEDLYVGNHGMMGLFRYL